MLFMQLARLTLNSPYSPVPRPVSRKLARQAAEEHEIHGGEVEAARREIAVSKRQSTVAEAAHAAEEEALEKP